MADYNPARKEIRNAKRKLEEMKKSNNYDDFEQAWRDFTGYIGLSHKMMMRAVGERTEKFRNAFSEKNKLKSSDELLVYIDQSRNSKEHLIQDLTKKVPASISYSSQPGVRRFHIDKMVIKNNMVTEYKGDPLVMTFNHETAAFLPIINRGNRYNVPKLHLGNDISRIDIPKAAELVISFYESWIDETESKFP
ncbi:hypothetical protein [Tatumella punctata]|uniref:Uncharacterized protein n=1 Tax=Tatumella punctata TaxID=399969 RepID=A0ABW1VNZ7_9GAMM